MSKTDTVPVPTETYSLEGERGIVYLIMDTWEGKDQAPATKPLNKRPFNSAGREEQAPWQQDEGPSRRQGEELMCTQAGPGPALHGAVLRRGPATHDSLRRPLGMVWALLPTHSRVPSCRDCLSCSPPNSRTCGHHYVCPTPVWR